MSKKFRYGDISSKEEILGLISQVHGEDKSDRVNSLWSWRYENCPKVVDDFNPFFVCELKDQIVGMVVLTPAHIKIGEHHYICCLVSDLMVHPDHRGLTGFQLTRQVLRLYPVMIGLPMPRVAELWKKVGCFRDDLCHFYLCSYPLTTKAVLQHKFSIDKIPLFRSSLKWVYKFVDHQPKQLQFIQVESFGEDFDPFFQKESTHYPILHEKNAAYMKWRYNDCPTGKYELFEIRKNGCMKGYTVLKTFSGEDGLVRTRIVDLFAANGDRQTYSCIIGNSIQFAIENQADIFQVVSPLNDPVQIAVLERKKKFLMRKKILHVVTGLCKLHEKAQTIFKNPENWHINFGDFDVEFI